MSETASGRGPGTERLHALDAVRAGALLLGVLLHATMTFLPDIQLWVLRDEPSHVLSAVFYVVHIFRMSLFFLIAGFFARMLYHRAGLGGFVRNRAVRIAAPFLVFYPIIGATTIACFIWAMRVTGQAPPMAAQARPEMSAATFPLTHLWFLYVLILFYVAALLLRAVVAAFDRDGRLRARIADPAMRLLTASPAASLLLALPLAGAFLLMPRWRGWLGIEPPAFGLVPHAAALVGFGTAFAFGWMLHRQCALFAPLQRWWAVQIALALPLTAFCLWQAGTTPSLDFTPRGGIWTAYAFAYALAVWAWTLGLIGAALRYLSAERPAIRYLADASYWIYIVHLPVLGVFQVALYPLPLPPLVKYPFILAGTCLVLLLSYEGMVRHSFIGRWLNGRKYPRSRRRESEPVVAAE